MERRERKDEDQGKGGKWKKKEKNETRRGEEEEVERGMGNAASMKDTMIGCQRIRSIDGHTVSQHIVGK